MTKPFEYPFVLSEIYYMKTIKYFIGLFLSVLILNYSSLAQASDSTGLPGDNFDLQGALQMFKEATSPENFETAINKEGNNINNLDLDGDGDIDYVRVIEKMDNDAHVFVLQVAISNTENQDIAVIEIEKTGPENAIIQIVGDEDIYGEQVIVEPDGETGNAYNEENYNINSNLSGPNVDFNFDKPGIVVNVWFWPSVRFIYAPAYRPWVSPWRWHYYPAWWKPWKPFGWHVWHPRRMHYHRPYAVVHTHRVVHAHKMYTPHRSSSVVVRNRHSASVNNYRVTRSKATVTGPRGNSATVKKTTVKGPRGNKATKVKVKRN